MTKDLAKCLWALRQMWRVYNTSTKGKQIAKEIAAAGKAIKAGGE